MRQTTAAIHLHLAPRNPPPALYITPLSDSESLFVARMASMDEDALLDGGDVMYTGLELIVVTPTLALPIALTLHLTLTLTNITIITVARVKAPAPTPGA